MPIPEVSPEYRSLSDWIVLKVLEAIRNGEIKSGEALVERKLADTLSLSRAPVRDAIHKLERLDVVERIGPRAFIKTWTDADVVETLQLLDALIAYSIQLSIGLLKPEDFNELEKIISETKSSIAQNSNNIKEQISLDFKFHLTIAKACQQKRLVTLIENLWLPMELYMETFLSGVGRDFSLHTHEELLEALKHGDMELALKCAKRTTDMSQKVILEALH
jgi:DNA-binding GntR family transcriptional regulator